MFLHRRRVSRVKKKQEEEKITPAIMVNGLEIEIKL